MKRNIDISVGEFYHIYNRGTERREIFSDKYDYNRFILQLYLCNNFEKVDLGELLKAEKNPHKIFKIQKAETLADIGAWCLMPNHFHLLLKEKVPGGISMFLQRLLTSHSKYYNKKYHRTGSLVESRFKVKHLDYDQYLKYQFAYIHLNPISLIESNWKDKTIFDIEKAQNFLKEYQHSSYLDYSVGERPQGNILNRDAFPGYFKNSVDFQEMVSEWVNFKTND